MDINKLPTILTISQVSKLLSVSLMTLRRWDNEGKLKSFRPSKTNRRRYSKEDVISFISQRQDSSFLTYKQQAELITALKGRKEIPLKFVYLEEGSKNWDKMVEDKNYGLGDTEKKMIKENIDRIYKYFEKRKYNIIDIGPGNGKKALFFIKRFSENYKPVFYATLDISQAMIDLAISNIKKEITDNIKINQAIIDFEGGNFSYLTKKYRKENYPNNFLLLLGNTVGNPFDKDRVLTNLRESMVLDDFILIGMEFANLNNIKKIIEHYKEPIVLDFCFFCLKKLGFNINDGKIKVVFNKKKSQIEMRFVFNRKSSILYNDEIIGFRKGDSVLLLISYKSAEKQLKNLLYRTGFKVVDFIVNKDNNYILTLCQPVRY